MTVLRRLEDFPSCYELQGEADERIALGLAPLGLNIKAPRRRRVFAEVNENGIRIRLRRQGVERYARFRHLREEAEAHEFWDLLSRAGILLDFVDEGETAIITAVRGMVRYLAYGEDDGSFLSRRLVLQHARRHRWALLQS